MRRRRGIISNLGALAIVRVVALCLVVLAISPFTAPFATFDGTELTQGTSIYDVKAAASKIAADLSDTGSPLIAIPLAPPTVVRRRPFEARLECHVVETLVLRI